MLDVKNTYRKPRRPYVPGEARIKCWRLPIITGDEAENPLWQRRAREYWARQSQLFGIEFHDNVTLQVDIFPEQQLAVITTSALIIRIMPGERIDMAATQ